MPTELCAIGAELADLLLCLLNTVLAEIVQLRSKCFVHASGWVGFAHPNQPNRVRIPASLFGSRKDPLPYYKNVI
ncbi:MAG: hypothetical protein Fur005_44540 [Roseiflexaceae bacterium]